MKLKDSLILSPMAMRLEQKDKSMSDNENSKSEVARLRQQIKDEYASVQQALHGPAIVGQHKFITTHMENMGKHHEQHKDLVGDEKAVQFLIEVMEDEEQLRRLFAEFLAIPSHFERFARERQVRDGKE